MYLSFLLLATFSSSFIPDCLGAAFIGKCADFGQIDGQLTTKIHWECFPNNTKTCTTRIYDCTSCDGQAGISSLTKPLAVAQVLEPKAQAGRMWSGHRKGRFRFKREVSARRHSPSFGRGEIKDSDKIKKKLKMAKKKLTLAKKKLMLGKMIGEVTAGDKLFTCDDVCLEKNGKYAKGQFEYTSFKDCEGGAKTEESSVQKEEETKDENKNDAAEEPETYEKDKEEKKATAKEVKDEKKEAARRRRMRRFRF